MSFAHYSAAAAALVAAALGVAGVVAICAGVSRVRGGQTELMGEFDLYRPAISDLDLLHPSPLDYHTFDYERPDFATSMDMNLLSGSIGMPSYHFFKQQDGASTQSLAMAGEGMNPSFLQAASVLQQTAVDRRSVMDNEERAEAARCSGMLHACANWMALRTGKMRIITYGEGSWCTDDEVCWTTVKSAISVLYDLLPEGRQQWSGSALSHAAHCLAHAVTSPGVGLSFYAGAGEGVLRGGQGNRQGQAVRHP